MNLFFLHAALAGLTLATLLEGRPAAAHPFCLNDEPPIMVRDTICHSSSKRIANSAPIRQPLERPRVCKKFSVYPGSCCSRTMEDIEIIIPRGRIVRGRDEASLDCRKFVQKLLCATCSPYSGHIFGSEFGEQRNYPTLCMPFCRRFYSICSNITMSTSNKPENVRTWRIPGLTSGQGETKINTFYPTADSFCGAFGGYDVGTCHSDAPGELIPPEAAPPPEIAGIKVLQLKNAYPMLNLSDISLPNVNWRLHLTDVTFLPVRNRVIATYQHGVAYWFENSPMVSQFSLFLDITRRASYQESTERGLMGLTLDPNFEINGYAYVKYTWLDYRVENHIRVSRFKLMPDKFQLDPDSERILIFVPRDGLMHHSGPVVFSPDGLMFIPVGDGQSSGAYGNASSPARFLTTLRGKVLRIDTRESATHANDWDGPLYKIPSDNPFVNTPNAKGEIYAYGYRNPWQISFDVRYNEVWQTDVGHNRFEEVNLVRKGDNGGWNDREGDSCYFPPVGCVDPPNYHKPVVWHAHVTWCVKLDIPNCQAANSLVGGQWYYGNAFPQFRNRFIYAEYELGKLFVLTIPNRNKPHENIVVETMQIQFPYPHPLRFRPVAVRTDPTGELVFANWNTPGIFKMVEIELPARAQSNGEDDEDYGDVSEESPVTAGLPSNSPGVGEFFHRGD